MANEMEVVIGGRLAKKLTLLDELDAPIATYTADAPLAIDCWRGDDQAALFQPSAAWIDASAGTIAMTISEAQSLALSVGRYQLLLTVTGSAGAAKHAIGWLDVRPAPGSAVARPVYCSWDEAKRYAGSWAEKLQRADSDQTGFAEERADAREEFDDLLHAHYRGGQVDALTGLRSLNSWTRARTGLKSPWLVEQLAADRLLVTKAIRECCSLMALAMVCRRQIDPAKDGGYARAASYFATRADDLAATITAEIDVDGDGVGDQAIILGAVDSLKG